VARRVLVVNFKAYETAFVARALAIARRLRESHLGSLGLELC